ncbi:MAG: exodeoxyribonuclease VII large subunit [Phycisphaerae bacterium]|nr:exodeoxyribonuclease VII large subunit [Phycisphaerae bacterium]
MTRPLFDPSKVVGPPPPTKADRGDPPLTVTAAAALISNALERALPRRLAIVGEISGLSVRTHWYFRLKDDNAVLDCVMFTSALRRVGFKPADGQKVVLTGRVEFYSKQGRTQFYAETMESVGAGELEQRFRALCAELKSLGWFDPERKRPLPTFPRRIAVITSRTGAALQDILVTAKRRCPAVEVATIDARVQGEDAADEIAAAVRWVSSKHESLGIDALLVTRGGGSIEDLWAFNERIVAQAIVECAIPVVAAIGHETDTTIAELVADVRAATPTQAAMLLTPDRSALADELAQASRRLRSLLSWLFDRKRDRLASLDRHIHHAAQARAVRARLRLERASARLDASRPAAVLEARRTAAAQLAAKLDRAILLAVERRRNRIDSLERELIIAGPASVLARGYSVTTDERGAVIRSTIAAIPGARVTTRVADGSFHSRIEGGSQDATTPAIPPVRIPARTRRTPGEPPDQMKLF